LKLVENLPEPGLQVGDWRAGQLFKRSELHCSDMSPSLGTEISNVDLRTLTPTEKNELYCTPLLLFFLSDVE
jgi:hypothetical protein